MPPLGLWPDGQCEFPEKPGKSQKEGRDDQGGVKGPVRGTPQCLFRSPGPLGLSPPWPPRSPIYICMQHFAEATAYAQVRLAKAVEEQCGPQGENCMVTDRLSRLGQRKNNCRDTHAVIRKAGLRLKVKTTRLSGNLKNVHVVLLSDYVQYMIDNHEIHRLWGGIPTKEVRSVLRCFWARFREVEPWHEIFSKFDAGIMDPSLVIPLYVHGDEGRGL
jgi:hypothetical protein